MSTKVLLARDGLVSVACACRLLRVPRTSLIRWADNGGVVKVKICGGTYVKYEDLLACIDPGLVAAANPPKATSSIPEEVL